MYSQRGESPLEVDMLILCVAVGVRVSALGFFEVGS